MIELDISITKKQKQFIDADADEVLFGGAAGGGKSYAQLIDVLLYALKFPHSKQLLLRRTYPELERSLIRSAFEIYPKEIYGYNSSKHTMTFNNKSVLDFGYCDSDRDVNMYQSSEYDVIRFDELTHFSDYQYKYLSSRLRGANVFPKRIKSSTNPGGPGHSWVKERFIDVSPPDTLYRAKNNTTRIFIPSLVTDNTFLMKNDPGYIKRLEALDKKDRAALLKGDWNIFEGQYFSEFDRDIHVTKPFPIPGEWKRYIAIDYGLDMLAALWIAVSNDGKAYVYKEAYKSGLIISEAAELIKKVNGADEITQRFAPPDLFNRRQETGKSAVDIFLDNGLYFYKSDNDRVAGWYALKEWLKPYTDEQGIKTAKLVIFDNCLNLIRTLPALTYDAKNPNDVANEPHELTHAPDALRAFISAKTWGAKAVSVDLTAQRGMDSFLSFGT